MDTLLIAYPSADVPCRHAQVYQVARALGALALTSSTVSTARAHALQVIHTEQALGIFIEPAVQGWFMARPTLMHWTNRIYSFVHIPATILFLIVLYYVTTTRPHSRRLRRMLENSSSGMVPGGRGTSSSPDTPRRSADGRRSPSPFPARSGAGAGAPILGAASPREGDTAATMGSTSRRLTPTLYQRARRTMAMCNLLAFVVFTLWPCMPPRLLSDPDYHGPAKDEATSYGFVDTVHSAAGESSVWTTNRFCNQYGRSWQRACAPRSPTDLY